MIYLGPPSLIDSNGDQVLALMGPVRVLSFHHTFYGLLWRVSHFFGETIPPRILEGDSYQSRLSWGLRSIRQLGLYII